MYPKRQKTNTNHNPHPQLAANTNRSGQKPESALETQHQGQRPNSVPNAKSNQMAAANAALSLLHRRRRG
jgi:hypothetical protein